jgi:Zn-finger nucleic acid-binding protein
MTIQNHILIELGDITALRLTCPSCRSVIACPAEQWQKIPVDCPNCSAEWMRGGTAEYESIRGFCRTLAEMQKHDKNIRCEIRLELNAPARGL